MAKSDQCMGMLTSDLHNRMCICEGRFQRWREISDVQIEKQTLVGIEFETSESEEQTLSLRSCTLH